ncbi:YfjI family protein [Rhodanobacter sp. UC4436_H3]
MSNNFFAPPPYPMHAFLVTVRDAGFELQRNVRAPDAMVGMSLAAAITMACQGLIVVKLPIGQIRPVTQNMLFIGESGERKSPVDGHVFEPFRDADALIEKSHEAALEAYQIENDWWQTVNNSIRRVIDKAFRDDEGMSEAKAKLAAHVKLKPKKPKLRTLVRNDITQRAIMNALEGDGESIVIMTDDGESLFKSGAMSNLGVLNRLWDSPKTLPLDRAGQEHVSVLNPRVSFWIMTQEEVLKTYCEKRGKLAKGSGHWARYLVGYPLTTKGTRWMAPDELVWEHLPKFHARVRELLVQFQDMMASGKIEREIIEFSEDAKARWIQQANDTEWMIRPGEYMSDIDDFASKTMEIIARLAASMHYFAGDGGKISLDTLERAIEIVAWHVDEFKRLFGARHVMPQEQADAYNVAKWLRTRVWRGWNSKSWIAKNDLRRDGPVRNRDRLNAALDVLEDEFAIWREQSPKNKQWFVCLQDKFFAEMAVA